MPDKESKPRPVTTFVSLLDEELLLLDDKCRAKIQNKVDEAIARKEMSTGHPDLTEQEVFFLTAVLDEAKTEKKISYRRLPIKSCDICGREAGFYGYTRDTQYHQKGEPNLKRPKRLFGFDLSDRFILIEGRAAIGGCLSCWEKMKPKVIEVLVGVEAEISKTITGVDPCFKQCQNRVCTVCGWEGHEGQMGISDALFGGTYPGRCPECNAENSLGSTRIKHNPGYSVVPVKTNA